MLFSLSFSQTVTLDPTFGNGGKTLTRFPNYNTGILSSKIQSDGKIVVCGFRNLSINFQSSGIILGRYNINGTIDTSFGTDGFVLINNLEIDGTGSKMLLIQPDGKIVVTGSNFGNSGYDFHTYRFHANGSPDITFGNNGVVITDISNSLDEPTALILQPDNKLLVLGTYSVVFNTRLLCAVRYTADGAIDNSFGTSGKALFGSLAANYSNQLMDVILETNGKIVLGAQHNIQGEQGNFVLAKLNADGAIDTGFGTNGARITNFGGNDFLMSIQKINGKYYAFGSSTENDNQSKIAVARYSISGSLDFSFGTNGKVLLNRSSIAVYDVIADARLVGDKIVCVGAGESENQSTPFNLDALLIRLNLDGTIDTTFNATGYVLSDFSNTQNDIFITLESLLDGKILALGTSTVFNDDSFILAKYYVSELNNINFSQSKISIYPNPFSESITIESKQTSLLNTTVELYDISGKKLSNFIIDNSSIFTLPIDKNLSKGNYFLKVANEGKIETLKIIKQ